MPTIQPIAFHGQQVRAYVNDDQKVWLFAVDVFSVLGIPNGNEVIASLPVTEKASIVLSEGEELIGHSLLIPETAIQMAHDIAEAEKFESGSDFLYRRALAAFDLAIRFRGEIGAETYQRMLDTATELWDEARESEE